MTPCADYPAALAASWRLAPDAGLMHPEDPRAGRACCTSRSASWGSMCTPVMPSRLRALDAWLDTWHSIGLIAHGLARQDRDLLLTRYRDRDRWGATVFVTGMEHSIAQGSGWQMTPWAAVQQAAFQTMHRGRYWSDQPRIL